MDYTENIHMVGIERPTGHVGEERWHLCALEQWVLEIHCIHLSILISVSQFICTMSELLHSTVLLRVSRSMRYRNFYLML